ncbi:MAG: MgtC/SapB family protein [Acidobacteria bacterium]|nr:MgtC/SapB family protein [Acidobacteriota bacterium]
MPVTVSWEQVALRILLAAIASFLIGYNRDERGHAMGIRSTMLVCLAATLAMLQANLLLGTAGRAQNSFVMLDLMRLPLGILSGIGFIGAGAILRKEGMVHGATTAATIWFVTVLGLLFGGGQLWLALTGSALALFILWALKRVEERLPTHRTGSLALEFGTPVDGGSHPTEEQVRQALESHGYAIESWNVHYAETALRSIECGLRWPAKRPLEPHTPAAALDLNRISTITSLVWRE